MSVPISPSVAAAIAALPVLPLASSRSSRKRGAPAHAAPPGVRRDRLGSLKASAPATAVGVRSCRAPSWPAARRRRLPSARESLRRPGRCLARNARARPSRRRWRRRCLGHHRSRRAWRAGDTGERIASLLTCLSHHRLADSSVRRCGRRLPATSRPRRANLSAVFVQVGSTAAARMRRAPSVSRAVCARNVRIAERTLYAWRAVSGMLVASRRTSSPNGDRRVGVWRRDQRVAASLRAAPGAPSAGANRRTLGRDRRSAHQHCRAARRRLGQAPSVRIRWGSAAAGLRGKGSSLPAEVRIAVSSAAPSASRSALAHISSTGWSHRHDARDHRQLLEVRLRGKNGSFKIGEEREAPLHLGTGN